MRKIISVVLMILLMVYTTACSYNPPIGATAKHHTYDEIVDYAKRIDPNSIVYETYNDIHLEDNMRSDYREWDAVINGISCHVASVPVIVWNEGIAAGEFAKQFFS